MKKPSFHWAFLRRKGDSNPWYLSVHLISNQAPSTTRTSLRRANSPISPGLSSRPRWYTIGMRPALLLLAHRGARRERPENTLVAFKHALDLGADALELDVHSTRDGVIVVHHDESLARSSGLPVFLRDVDWSALQHVDVGHTFVDEHGRSPYAGTRLSRLEDVLDELPGIPLNVDLKPDSPALCAAVLSLVRSRRATEHVRLASFCTQNLLRIRRARYEGQTSYGPRGVLLLASGARRLLGRLGELADAAQVPTHYGRLRLDTPRFLREVHATGAKAHFWTINDPAEAARLLALGADGIVTDDVRAIKPVFDQRRTSGSTNR